MNMITEIQRTETKPVIRPRWLSIECMVATLAVGLGIWLINPAWKTFSLASTYEAMAALAPEEYWGWGLLGIGAILWYAHWRHLRTLRAVFLLVLAMGWGFIAMMFAMANLGSWGIILFGTPMIYSLGTFIWYSHETTD